MRTSYVHNIKVVKIGGNVVDNEAMLQSFCKDFAAMSGPKVLVHGGGVMASAIQEALGQTPVKIEGRRVTDEDTLKVVTMTYAGWCNKHITALLQGCGCNAIGLSGCDASVITASRRAPRLLKDGVTKVDYGFVGDVKGESVNTAFINSLLEMGITPVFCAINHDGKGNLLNTNADTIASSVAKALAERFEVTLVYCFEKAGVLKDPAKIRDSWQATFGGSGNANKVAVLEDTTQVVAEEEMIAIQNELPPPPPEAPSIPVLSDVIDIVEDDIKLDDDLFINLEDNNQAIEIQDYKEAEVEEEEVEEEAIPFQLVEQKPSFNGGDANEFSKWVNSRLVYPEIAKENGVQGRVTLQFTVEADGRVTNVRVLRGVDESLDKEAVRVVSSSPKWKPGKQRDRAVKVTYTFPVIFQLR